MQNSDVSFNSEDPNYHGVLAQQSKVPLGKVQSRFLDVGIIGCLLVATLLINLRLIRDGITGLGDVRWHLTWLQHFSYQLSEGSGYPRWLAGTNFGYGSPTFVFYPPLIYYCGAALRALGFTFEQMVNILFAGGVFLSGVSFYSFGRFRWGQIPGVFGALAYMLSPGLLGVAHGGGLAPLYSFVWLPLLLLFTDKSISSGRWRAALAMVWGLVALTHLPSLLIYAIAWIPYTLYLLRQQPWSIKICIWLSALIGWGLASFFLIPAILEQRYINIDYMLASQDGFEAAMMNVMDTVRQGWGDRIVQQWLACIALSLIAAVGYLSRPKQQKTVGIVLLVAIGITFLISDWSWPLWKIAPVVKKIEYSTRIDRLLYMAQAVLCALAVQALLRPQWAVRQAVKRFGQALLMVIVCAILFGNFKAHHLEVRKFPGLYSSGNGVMLNRDWIETIVHDPLSDRLIDVPEYRPRLAASAPQTFIKEVHTGAGLPEITATVSGSLPTPQPNQPKFEIVEGDADVVVLDWQSEQRRLNINAKTEASVILRVYNYPAWNMAIDNEPHPIQTAYDGRIQFDIAPGQHEVILRYGLTSALWLGIVATILSAVAFVGIYCYRPLS
ncbi:MAG: 6-pyruvoyl-tetrahydropterin synthase-related protein [Phormidesmis sp.]